MSSYVRGRFELTQPEKMEASLTITMSIEDWQRLNKQLSSDWPAWELSQLISRIVSKANQAFVETVEKP